MTTDQYEFHTGHAMLLLDVSRRTVYRWLQSGVIASYQSPISRKHQFSLNEINRIRTLRGQTVLSKEEAIKIWSQN